MKRSMLQTCILGICVLQGLLGFTAVGYADQWITVSQDPFDEANYTSITDAVADAAALLQDMANGQLPEDDVIIQVLDGGPYEESVYLSYIPTSLSATLTLESTALGGTTIHTPLATVDEPGARPLTITQTDFVTIRGFIFMKDVPNEETDIMTLVKFKDYAPADSQVTFEYCVWEGRGLTYDLGAVLFCRYAHCNITVQNSTFRNIVVGPINASLIYLGWRSLPMANTPTFTFRNNQVINNTDALVQFEGDAANGYYHNLIIEGNVFTGNTGDADLLFIRNQRADNDISRNRFFGNGLSGIPVDVFSGMTLALINSGSAVVAYNEFIQNGAMAEVFVQASRPGTTVLTNNTIAASGGPHFGVWAALTGKAALQSGGNFFYSDYNNNASWNEPTKDYVAYWATGKAQNLTLSLWNAKTPKDGNDSFGVLPPPAQ